MRLNPDCIRDVLLTVENNTDYSKSWYFNKENLLEKPLCNYSSDEVIYHISQCYKAGLIDGCKFYDGGIAGTVGDLSPSGHQFLADIRSDSVWNNVKEVSKKVGSNSLQAISQIATGVITEIIKLQLGITSINA